MRAVLLSVLPLLLGICLSVTGSGALGTVLGVRVDLLGYPTLFAGAIGAAYFAGQLFGALYLHKPVQAVGHVRGFAAFSALLASATLMHGLVINPPVWIVLRLIEGACVAGLFLCTESWLNERTGNDTRGRVLSLYMIVIYAGIGTGQYLMVLYAVDDFALLGVIAVLMSLGLVPVALSTGPTPALPAAGKVSLLGLWRDAPAALIGCVGSGMVLGPFYSIAPLYAQNVGLDQASVALAMSLGIYGGLLAQWPVGRISDLADRRVVLVGLFAVTLMTSLVLAIMGPGLGKVGVLALFALFGTAIFALYPVAVAHAYDRVSPERMVQASAAMLVSYSLGASLGPLGASGLMTGVGPAGLYYFTAGTALLSVVMVLLRIRTRSPVDPEERAPFNVSPSTSRVLVELDPRVPDSLPQDADVKP